jgi:hypothetical protein
MPFLPQASRSGAMSISRKAVAQAAGENGEARMRPALAFSMWKA